MRGRLLEMLPVGSRGADILRTGTYALLAKASSAGNLFVAMPFVHQSLDSNGFGAWATLTSFATIAGFLDFGFSNGAMNLVASAHARGDQREVYALARGTWRILCRTALVLALAALLILAFLPWRSLLGLDPDMGPQAGAATAATLASMVAGVPLGLALRMQLATGSATSGYKFAAAGQLLACAATIILARHGATLPMLVVATLWPPLLLSIANTFIFARKLRAPVQADATVAPNQPSILKIQQEGILFFVLQLAAVLAYTCDLPLISALVGAEEAGRYAIVQRLFSLVPLALGLLWAPLWPSYRQALARGEYDWAFLAFRQTVSGALLAAGIAATACWYWFDPISVIWMQTSISPPPLLLAGMAAWAVADAAGGAYGTFLNAAGMFRFLVTTACLSSVTTFALKYWLAANGYIALLPWATLACFLMIDVFPLIVLWPSMKRNIRAKSY